MPHLMPRLITPFAACAFELLLMIEQDTAEVLGFGTEFVNAEVAFARAGELISVVLRSPARLGID